MLCGERVGGRGGGEEGQRLLLFDRCRRRWKVTCPQAWMWLGEGRHSMLASAILRAAEFGIAPRKSSAQVWSTWPSSEFPLYTPDPIYGGLINNHLYGYSVV